MFGIVALALAAASVPIPAPMTQSSPPGCWVEPLQITLTDALLVGRVAEQVARDHCMRDRRWDPIRPMGPSFKVASTRLGRFTLFGESLNYGLDVVVVPQLNHPDLIYATPALDLPRSWQLAIDKATYPVLIVGGAALLTTIIFDLAKPDRSPRRR